MQPASYCVLVIDDDDNMLTLLKLLLERRGHRPLIALDGEVGLRLAEVEQPDIILLDLALPRRDGLDVYLDLRNNDRTATIPILVFSAAVRQDLGVWYTLPGVVDVYAKPFDFTCLVTRIEEICSEGTRQIGA